MANTRKGRKKTTKKNIKNGDKLKATLPKDLFRDPTTGSVQQKRDDDGIWNRRYLELKKKGLA